MFGDWLAVLVNVTVCILSHSTDKALITLWLIYSFRKPPTTVIGIVTLRKNMLKSSAWLSLWTSKEFHAVSSIFNETTVIGIYKVRKNRVKSYLHTCAYLNITQSKGKSMCKLKCKHNACDASFKLNVVQFANIVTTAVKLLKSSTRVQIYKWIIGYALNKEGMKGH